MEYDKSTVRQLNKSIDRLEALGLLVLEEVKQMRKRLGAINDHAPLKGKSKLTAKDLQLIVAKRMRPISSVKKINPSD